MLVRLPKSVIRECMPLRKFMKYMELIGSRIIDVEHFSLEEVIDQQVWWDATVEEYTSIIMNDVWDILLRPDGKSYVSSMCLYKIKHVSYGSIKNFKERFVVINFSQKVGVDYEEKISLAMYASIQAIICISIVIRWRIHHMDVKTIFLNEIIKEEVYID
jgi:hypothetical protein